MDVEQTHMIEVGGNVDPGDADISLSCRRCDWHVWLDVGEETGPTLADLIDEADAHFDAADHR